MLNFIKSIYEGKILENDKKLIKPYELDLVLPEIKLAIEFNGTYFHSIEAGYELGYHLMKTEMCESVGYRLIHIWEHDWLNNKNEIESKLTNIILGNEIIDYSQPLDRFWYECKEMIGYNIEIINPEIISVQRDKNTIFNIETCGKLKYTRKNENEICEN